MLSQNMPLTRTDDLELKALEKEEIQEVLSDHPFPSKSRTYISCKKGALPMLGRGKYFITLDGKLIPR